MLVSRAKLKQHLPRGLIVLIKRLLALTQRTNARFRRLAFPLLRRSYEIAISAFPNSRWPLDGMLNLIDRHNGDGPIVRAKMFLKYFENYRERFPDCIMQWRVSASIAHLMLHDVAGLQRVMQDFMDRQQDIIREKKLDELGLRIVTEDMFQSYNVHGYLDTHVKAMQLGWMPAHKIVQLIPPGDLVANPAMLGYWSKYITVIRDAETIERLTPLRLFLEEDLALTASLNSKAVYIEHAKGIVQKEWERQSRKPLLQLSDEDNEFGRDLLEKVGIPRDAWFVSLHVRDAGYKNGSHLAADEYDSYRNADIESYRLAVEEVVRRGGYVVRVGDPNMKPFAPATGYFDYALSDIRSNRMDIFLFSQCRCFVGVSSGPVLNPVLFGVPVVMTNFAPMSGRPHAGNCIFIPKLLRLRNEDRYATFREVLSSDLGRMFTSHGYDKNNVDLIDNSPEDLRDVVAEMLDRLDGNAAYSDEDDGRQRAITALYRQYSGYGDMGRMGRGFLEKYANQGLL